MHIINIVETASTNAYIREWSNQNPDRDVAICTQHQIAGRGQRGNTWEAENGKNLTFSIVIHPAHIRADEQFVLSQLVSLSLVEVLDEYGIPTSIKWPNDIYWQQQKLCGILIENDLDGNHLCRSIIGIGLNVNQISFLSDAPNPVSMQQITGQTFNLQDLLCKIVTRFEQRYYQLLSSSESALSLQAEYHQRLFRRSGFYWYRDADGDFRGRIVKVGTGGRLMLEREDGTICEYAFKEVQFVLSGL